jgi:hypothetical protein
MIGTVVLSRSARIATQPAAHRWVALAAEEAAMAVAMACVAALEVEEASGLVVVTAEALAAADMVVVEEDMAVVGMLEVVLLRLSQPPPTPSPTLRPLEASAARRSMFEM